LWKPAGSHGAGRLGTQPDQWQAGARPAGTDLTKGENIIIATIGNASLKLENLKDAEALLDIANRATLVEKTYDLDYRDFHYISQGEKRIGIEVIESNTIHSIEHYHEVLAARAAKEKAAAEARKTAEAA
jgi:hypothetical protein